VIEPFELAWMGAVAERHVRRKRPGVDELPWGTLRLRDYPPLLVERARVSWTEGAFNEYCSAAAFAEVCAALLAARAPIDLVGMAGDFVGDEMLHVELNARLAMELGGGAPYRVDFAELAPRPSRRLTPLQRASDLVVRVCCVGEAYSVPMLAGSMQAARHPLTRAVLERIAQDEPPHARLGWLYLEWAAPSFDARERARLARVALDALAGMQPYWKRLQSRVREGVTSEGFELAHVHELGWMEAQAYGATARRVVREDVVAPLRACGIELDEAAVAELLV
jgi:hypothetical protein